MNEERTVTMIRTPNIPTWKELDRVLQENKLTGKITLNCHQGSVVEFEIMQRFKAEKEGKDED